MRLMYGQASGECQDATVATSGTARTRPSRSLLNISIARLVVSRIARPPSEQSTAHYALREQVTGNKRRSAVTLRLWVREPRDASARSSLSPTNANFVWRSAAKAHARQRCVCRLALPGGIISMHQLAARGFLYCGRPPLPRCPRPADRSDRQTLSTRGMRTGPHAATASKLCATIYRPKDAKGQLPFILLRTFTAASTRAGPVTAGIAYLKGPRR